MKDCAQELLENKINLKAFVIPNQVYLLLADVIADRIGIANILGFFTL